MPSNLNPQPPSQRPNTPIESKDAKAGRHAALERQWAQVNKKPPAGAVGESDARVIAGNKLPLLPVGTPKGKWGYSPELTNQMLWREFQGKEFVWTIKGKERFGAKAAIAFKQSKEKEKAGKEAAEQLLGFQQEKNKLFDCLDDDLRTFLTEPIGAIQDLMVDFMWDIGFSVPLLNTIKASVMAAYSVYAAIDAKWEKHSVQTISKDIRVHDMKESPLFNLAQGSLVDTFDQNMNYALIDLGDYTFDLVASLQPLGAIANEATAVARLLWKIRRLFNTWNTTRTINQALKSTTPPDMCKLISDHPLFGCHIFRMNNLVLTGRFTDLNCGCFETDSSCAPETIGFKQSKE